MTKSSALTLKDVTLVTAAYCGQFQFGLAVAELWRRMIQPPSILSLSEALPLLAPLQTKVVKAAWTDQRRAMQPAVRRKWQEVETVVRWVSKIPWVDAILVTGGLAMNTAQPDDDVDFLLVVQPKRLWLCRVLVSLFALGAGRRRSWHGNEPNSWCFNMWLERGKVAMSPDRQSLYEAYEVLQAKPVWQRRGALAEWYRMNVWVKKWCPHWWASLGSSGSEQQQVVSAQNFLINWANSIAYWLQFWYMKKHITLEKVTPTQAFFHPRPTKKLIVEGWQQIVLQYNEPHARAFFTKLSHTFSSH